MLPLVGPYILSGYAFAFVLSLNEYIVAYMVAGFTIETLPIKIFNSLRYGYTPTMAAVTVVFVALCGARLRADRPLRRPAAAARRLGLEGELMRLAAFQMVARKGDVAANLGHDRGRRRRGEGERRGRFWSRRSSPRPAMAAASSSALSPSRPTARRSPRSPRWRRSNGIAHRRRLCRAGRRTHLQFGGVGRAFRPRARSIANATSTATMSARFSRPATAPPASSSSAD